MNKQAFEIRCPVCRSVVPHEASGCPTCAAGRQQEAAPVVSIPAPPAPRAPDVGGMALKEYHRFVRSNHRTVEGPHVAGQPGVALALRTYVPMLLLLLGLVVGAALAFGRL
jgi:hypothetical protein